MMMMMMMIAKLGLNEMMTMQCEATVEINVFLL